MPLFHSDVEALIYSAGADLQLCFARIFIAAVDFRCFCGFSVNFSCFRGSLQCTQDDGNPPVALPMDCCQMFGQASRTAPLLLASLNRTAQEGFVNVVALDGDDQLNGLPLSC
jgi:hypothetical protein